MLVDMSIGAAVAGTPYDVSADASDEGDADLDWVDAPPAPQWVLAAQSASVREDLAAATSAPVDRDALALLTLLDPHALADAACRTGIDGHRGADARQAARTLLDGIVVAQRAINHAYAIQQRLIAAFCRPGVAIPLVDLMDMAGDDLTDALATAVDAAVDGVGCAAAAGAVDAGAESDPTADAGATDNSATGRDPSSLLSHPVWAQVLRDAAVKTASSEIGCALRLAPVTARIHCARATDLVDYLPATVAGQQSGDIDAFRARLLAEKLAVLPEDLRHRIELRVLPSASMRSMAGFKRIIDREVIAADPAAAQRRVERAKAGRSVYTSRGEDGAGIFTAIVSASDAELASPTLDAIAASLASDGLAGGRTRTQLRADAFCDLFRSLADTGHVTITSPRRDSRGRESCGREPRNDSPGPAAHRPGNEPAESHDKCDVDTCDVHGAGDSSTCGANPCGTSTCDTNDGADRDTPCPSGAGPAAIVPSWCGSALPTGRAGSPASVRRPTALNVYLDASTLAGFDNGPAELAGVGAITADTARALAASADTVRAIITRPTVPGRTCDTILDAGRSVYRPPDKTADYVAARDRTCTFPGCRMRASRCDLDHRHPYGSGGDTCPCNLDVLCRSHHRLKTFTGWAAVPDPSTGRLLWSSPLGRHYPTEQAHLLYDHPAAPDPTCLTTPHTPADDPPPF